MLEDVDGRKSMWLEAEQRLIPVRVGKYWHTKYAEKVKFVWRKQHWALITRLLYIRIANEYQSGHADQ